MVESLLDGLSTDRVEIDMIEFAGIEFRHVDNRVMSLKLVQLGLSDAAMFGPSGEVLQPSEVLRKRPILVERGSFRPVTKVNIDMINGANQLFAEELGPAEGGEIVELMEITMRNLLASGEIDLNDDRDTALALFSLVNLVAQWMITNPKDVAEIYELLPESKREAIDDRDGRAT